MYLTPTDASTIGRSILTSSLLRPALTRRWMKPISFTSDPTSSVGAPWEIRRVAIGPNNRIVDLYTKSGDLPGYSSNLILIPDYDLGFIIMTAGDAAHTNTIVLANMVVDALLPAVEEAAREEADAAFSGIYESSDKALNSSLTIASDPLKPGLGVTSWMSNGTDMLAADILAPIVRLYPSGLSRNLKNGDVQVGFRAVFESPEVPLGGPFNQQCFTWAGVDGTYYGAVSTDEFLFTLDGNRKTKSVSPRVLRADLDKMT